MTAPNTTTWRFKADDDLSGALAKMAGVAEAAEKAFDDLGDEAKQAAAQMTLAEKASAKVTRELAEQKRKVVELSAAYALLGDAVTKEQKAELAAARARQTQLQQAFDALHPKMPNPPKIPKPPVPPVGGGDGLFGGLFSGKIGSPLLLAGIGAGVAASPVLAGVVGAAVQAALGGGAIATGIAAGVQDPRVKQAFAPLGEELKLVFTESGRPFVQPLVEAADVFRDELAGVREDWVKGVGAMSSVVEPLARGIAGLFRRATPGFLRALEASRPTLEMLAAKLPGLGEDISTFLDSIASAGPAATQAMGDLVDGLGDLLVVSGETVEHLSKVYYWGTQLGALNYAREPQVALIKGIGSAARDAATGVDGLKRSTEELLEQFLSMDEMKIRIAEGFDEIREAAGEGGRSLSLLTDQGRNLRQAIIDQIDAFVLQRQQMIDNGLAAAHANDVYNKNIDALYRQAIAAGVSRKALEELLIPYNLLKSKDITLRFTTVMTGGGRAFQAPGGVRFMAGGGPVEAGQPYVVGDRGVPELFVPEHDGRILPSVPSGTVGGGDLGVLTVRVVHQYPDGRVIADQVQQLAVQKGTRALSKVLGLQAA